MHYIALKGPSTVRLLQMTALLDAILNYFNYPRVKRWNPLGSFVAYSSSTPFIK